MEVALKSTNVFPALLLPVHADLLNDRFVKEEKGQEFTAAGWFLFQDCPYMLNYFITKLLIYFFTPYTNTAFVLKESRKVCLSSGFRIQDF